MRKALSATLGCIALCLLILACPAIGDPTPTPEPTATPAPTATPVQNQLPVVNAGTDLVIGWDQTASFSASASDADGDILSYLWTLAGKPNGSALTNADITGATALNASLKPDLEGAYLLDLTVSDGQATVTDRLVVTMSPSANLPPVAVPKVNLARCVPGSTVQFSGYGVDPDSDPLQFSLTMVSQPLGSALTFQDDDSFYYSANSINSQDLVLSIVGDYVYRLSVSDGRGGSHSAQLTVQVLEANPDGNTAPFASAGPDISLSQDYSPMFIAPVILDGSGCSDLDGDTLSYLWECIEAPPAVTDLSDIERILSSSTDMSPVITSAFIPHGDYVFRLTVNDGQDFGASGTPPDEASIVTDSMTLSIIDVPAIIRSFSATPSAANVEDAQTVTLSAIVNGDADVLNELPTNYSFTLLSRPEGSSAELSASNHSYTGEISITTSFIPDIVGDYQVRFSLTENGSVSSRTITVEAYDDSQGGVNIHVR